MASARDINALLGSRICHDLISPLGAIGNGVELLAMSGISAAPEIALIVESVENANARIRFFRIAFGAASPDQAVSAQEAQSILGDMSRGGRLSYRWTPRADLPRTEVKLAFLLLQCLESAMPFGGDAEVTHDGMDWQVTGTADRLKIVGDHWNLLVDPTAETEVSAAHVQFLLVSDAARRAGRRVSTDLSDHRIRIAF